MLVPGSPVVSLPETMSLTMMNSYVVILTTVWSLSLSAILVKSSPLDPADVIGRSSGFVLNAFIRHHEPARYDPAALRAHHHRERVRRSAFGSDITSNAATTLRLDIKTNDRVFKLRLQPDSRLFANDVEFESTRGRVAFDPSIVYIGTLEDDETAIVHGLITTDGLFDGTISTKLEDYYIEPVARYLNTSSDNVDPESLSPRYHTIVYKASDVVRPHELHSRTTHCASHLLNAGIKIARDDNRVVSKENNIVSTDNVARAYGRSERDTGSDVRNVAASASSSLVDAGSGSVFHRAKRWLPEEDHHVYNSNWVYGPTRGILLGVGNEPYHPNKANRPPPSGSSRPTLFDLNTPYNNQDTEPNLINRADAKPKITRKNILVAEGAGLDVDENGDTKTFFDIGGLSDDEPISANDSGFRHVHKRATIDPKKTTCMLYLQADHQFFQKYGTEEACIEVMTRHVQRVNAIYKTTDFNQDGKPDNISFMIKRIKVHSMDAVKDPLYRFPNNYGVEKFLELFSEENYDAFCLAYMFTYRDFEMGTLGLAWTGDLKNAGGVCEKNGHYRGSMKSLNTGIVTLLNYGKHVPPAVSHVTLAHEIGHNFGSPHDPELCTPGGEDGNFIMFARATSGDKKNNNHFSPCSLKSINPVLNYKARSTKGCFTEPQIAICGNGVVEEGEECDCGWEGDCHDQCCHPQRNKPPLDETPCKLTAGSDCSPSQGPCCTSECRLKFGEKCRDDNGCRDASYCNGRGPQCPPSINKANKTICNNEFVCFMGECTGSICLAYGLESCQCIPGPQDPKTKACELCCKLPGDNQPCLSSFAWNEMPYDVPDMNSKPGTPCNDYNGYCDVFQKCREVDPSGPLATLRKLLLSEESIESFKKWVLDYWYAVTLIIIAVIALLVMSTKYLGKRPNLKLKSVTIIHSSTTETVRLPSDGERGQVTVHPGVRSKLPLKQKVRNGKKRRSRHSKETTNNNSSPKKGKNILKKKRTTKVSNHTDDSPKRSNETSKSEAPRTKTKKPSNKVAPTKQKKKKKEVIDYSSEQKDQDTKGIINGETENVVTTPDCDTDPVGKVQNWLLKSQLPVVIPKSKSTPAGLTERSSRSPRKHRPQTLRPTTDKSKSVGYLPGDKEKMRLQVIYKPPFKFSVKLRKADKSSVVVDRSGQRVADRSDNARQVSRRTGLLVRSIKDQRNRHSDKTPTAATIDNTLAPFTQLPLPTALPANLISATDDDINSNIHTVQSDLEVLLSESEFLFSDG